MAKRGRTVGALNVRLGATANAFTRSLRRSRRSLKNFGRGFQRTARTVSRSVGRIVARLGGMAAAITGVAGVAGFGLLVRNAMKSTDVLAKTGAKLGIATGELVKLQHAAELSGLSVTTFQTALQRMVRRISEAAVGTGEAQAALKELGVDAAKLNKMTPDRKFYELARAMRAIQNPADRLRLTVKLFDMEGAGMVNILTKGAAGLHDAARRAEKLGLVLSEVDAKQVEDANDALMELRRVVTGTARIVAVKLSPLIAGLANELVNAATRGKGLKDNLRSAFETGNLWGNIFLDTLHFMSRRVIVLTGHMAEFVGRMRVGLRTVQDIVSPTKIRGGFIGGARSALRMFMPAAITDPSGLVPRAMTVMDEWLATYDTANKAFGRTQEGFRRTKLQEAIADLRAVRNETQKTLDEFDKRRPPSQRLAAWVQEVANAARRAVEAAAGQADIALQNTAMALPQMREVLRFAPAMQAGSYAAMRAQFASQFQSQRNQPQVQTAKNTAKTANNTTSMKASLQQLAWSLARSTPLTIVPLG